MKRVLAGLLCLSLATQALGQPLAVSYAPNLKLVLREYRTLRSPKDLLANLERMTNSKVRNLITEKLAPGMDQPLPNLSLDEPGVLKISDRQSGLEVRVDFKEWEQGNFAVNGTRIRWDEQKMEEIWKQIEAAVPATHAWERYNLIPEAQAATLIVLLVVTLIAWSALALSNDMCKSALNSAVVECERLFRELGSPPVGRENRESVDAEFSAFLRIKEHVASCEKSNDELKRLFAPWKACMAKLIERHSKVMSAPQPAAGTQPGG